MTPVVNLTLTFSVGDTMMILKPNKHGQFENVVIIADDGDVRSVPLDEAANILSAKHGQFENVVIIADDGDVRSVPLDEAANILSAFFKAREKRAKESK